MLFPSPGHLNSPHRVVITGAGIVTALGRNWQENEAGFRAGRTAFRPVTLFDVSAQRARIAAEADLPADLPPNRLRAQETRRTERAGRLLLVAALEAWQQAGWESSTRLPIVLGTTSGGMSLGEAYYRQTISPSPRSRSQPARALHYQPQRQALDLAEALGIEADICIIANACASGANAIGHAAELVKSGRCDRVITGGYDALSQLVFCGFDSLQALSPAQPRPFDANRDGLGLGEGAGVLCLESLDHARRRGAQILGEIAGYGACTDAHHLTQPHPNGDAALAAMTAACETAQVSPDRIGYINAHGTGTPLNDSAEACAINRWAGPHATKIPVSSTKAAIGHLLGAAGAVEAIVCLMALRGRWLPPTTVIRTPEPACAFPLVREPRDADFDYALTNSFGFGGANATLILRRWA